jgi:hypothetical protein
VHRLPLSRAAAAGPETSAHSTYAALRRRGRRRPPTTSDIRMSGYAGQAPSEPDMRKWRLRTGGQSPPPPATFACPGTPARPPSEPDMRKWRLRPGAQSPPPPATFACPGTPAGVSARPYPSGVSPAQRDTAAWAMGGVTALQCLTAGAGRLVGDHWSPLRLSASPGAGRSPEASRGPHETWCRCACHRPPPGRSTRVPWSSSYTSQEASRRPEILLEPRGATPEGTAGQVLAS